MSIVPAIFVVIAACLGVNAPIEARIVSVHLRKIAPAQERERGSNNVPA